MALQVRGVQTNSQSSSSPLTVDSVPATAAGDVVLLHVNLSSSSAAVTSLPSGFTLIAEITGVTSVRIYRKDSAGSEPATYDVGRTLFGLGSLGVLVIYSDSLDTIITDDFATLTTEESSSSIFPSVLSRENGLLTCFSNCSIPSSATPPIGMTERYDLNGSGRLYLMTGLIPLGGETGLNIAKHSSGVAGTESNCISIVFGEDSDVFPDPRVEATVSGAIIEVEQDPGVNVTLSGAIVEVGNESVHVTLSGAIVEFGDDAAHVTKFGTIAEIEYGDDLAIVTKFGVIVEIDYLQPMPTYFPSPLSFKHHHKILPEAVTGYQLDAGGSFWSVVIPHGSRNLVVTPSMQRIINTFLSVVNWDSFELSSDHASRGFRSLKCIPQTGIAGYVNYTFYPLVAGYYNFGLDVYAKAGQIFEVIITNQAQTVTFSIGEIVAKETGWARYNVIYVEPDPTPRFATLRFSHLNTDLTPIYTDGWLVSDGKEEQLFFDGDTQDHSFSSDPYAFAWEGTPHFSYSVRANRTLSGGYIRSFYDLDFRTTGILGLGLGDSEPDLVVMSDGEEVLRGNRTGAKDFSIIGMVGGRDLYDLQKRRQTLIDYLNRLNSTTGGVTLMYQAVNATGVPLGTRLLMECAFIGGMAGQWDNNYQETVELRFRLMSSKLYDEFGEVATLAMGAEPDPSTLLYSQSPRTGEWNEYAVADNDTVGGNISAILVLDTGHIIAGGDFSAIGGVSAANIAIWSPFTGLWAEFGGGLNGAVSALGLGRGLYEGQIIVAGGFTATEDTLTVLRHLARVTTGGIWNEIGTGLNNDVHLMLVHPTGRIFVTGTFTADNTATTLDNFAYFDGRLAGDSAFHNLLTEPPNFPITSLVLAPDLNLYIGGNFTELNGDVDFNAVAYFNIVEAAFPLTAYNNLNKGLNAAVTDMVLGADGYLYAVGDFTADVAAGVVVRKFARWTGNVWEEIGDNYLTGVELYKIVADKRGNFYISHEPFGDNGDPEAFADTTKTGWNGSAWFPVDIRNHTAAPPAVDPMIVTSDGRVFFTTQPASETILSGHTLINYVGSADAQIRMQLVGPCIVHRLSNWTAGKYIYFRAFELADGEEFTLDLTGPSPKAFTTTRPDVLNFVIAGSSNVSDFRLLPGENHITLLTSGTYNDTTQAIISWNNHYWSIDSGLLGHER